jgi:pyruvate dehydrogenase E2 component (dihydrolipoamide acetyltransferase)
MSVFRMPSLGADMEAGTLVEWLIKKGDTVAHGDVIAVVETHKGAIEIESFETGVVERLDVQVGQSVPVGTPMAVIRSAGEAPGGEVTTPDTGKIPPQEMSEEIVETGVEKRKVAKQKIVTQEIHQSATKATIPESELIPQHLPQPAVVARGPLLASPAARLRAAEAGVDLNHIPGSGPDSAVLLSDVEHWLSAGKKSVPTNTTDVLSAKAVPSPPEAPTATRKRQAVKPGLDMALMRKAIAAAMSRSKREIPHYYLSHCADLQVAADWLSARNAARDPEQRLLMGALFVKATVLAVAKVAELNGTYEDEVFLPSAVVNCGLAISMRGGGLIAPALLDAGTKTLDELMLAMHDVVARTRTGRLRNSEITQGTITVSSMGENGSDSLFGVIYPPQVALVGFGTPVRRAWVVDDAVQIRSTVEITLAADHRVSDGRRGALLLSEIERLLREPDKL